MDTLALWITSRSPCPEASGGFCLLLTRGKGELSGYSKAVKTLVQSTLKIPQVRAGCHCPKGISTSGGPVPPAQTLLVLIVSECLFVPPGLSLQNHWTAQGIEVLMCSSRIKFQDLINTQ